MNSHRVRFRAGVLVGVRFRVDAEFRVILRVVFGTGVL